MNNTIPVAFPGQWWWATKDIGLAPTGLRRAPGPVRWDVVGATVAEAVRSAEDRLNGLVLRPYERVAHRSVLVLVPDDLSAEERAVVRRWVSNEDSRVDGAPDHLVSGAEELASAWAASPGLVLPVRSSTLRQLGEAVDHPDRRHLEASALDLEGVEAWFQSPERTAYQQDVNRSHLERLHAASVKVTDLRLTLAAGGRPDGPPAQRWPRSAGPATPGPRPAL
jgi:hypothetical protein